MTTIILSSVILILLAFIVLKKNYMYKYKTISPIEFKIENQDPTQKKVVLFGKNHNLLSPNFGSDIPIVVNCNKHQITYLQALQFISDGDIRTSIIEISVPKSHENKIRDTVIKVVKRDMNGLLNIRHINLYEKYKLALENDLYDENLGYTTFKICEFIDLDGNTELTFDLLFKDIILNFHLRKKSLIKTNYISYLLKK